MVDLADQVKVVAACPMETGSSCWQLYILKDFFANVFTAEGAAVEKLKLV